MSRLSQWWRYWLENFKAGKDRYDVTTLFLSSFFFLAGIFLRTTTDQTPLMPFVSDEVLGRVCTWGGVGLFVWCFAWWPFCRHEAQELKHKAEVSVLKNCQDRRALLKKIIEAIKKAQEPLIVGMSREPKNIVITGPIDSIAGLIAFAEEIKNEDEVEWLCQELVKHGFDHPFSVTDLYCDDFMLGHRLPVLREAGLSLHRPLSGQWFIKFLEERWSGKDKWLEIKRKYNEVMAMAPLLKK